MQKNAFWKYPLQRRFLLDFYKTKSYNKGMEQRMYFDHAATTPLDKEVLLAMTPYLTEHFGNADSPHAFGRTAMNAVDLSRDKIAELIGAKPNEIYFTSGGTESDNWALIGGARAKRKEGKTRVVLSAIEHHALLFAASQLQKEGFEVVYLPVNAGGEVEENALQNAINPQTAIVALMYVNNETGVMQPVQKARELAHKNGALFFTDAVQAAPHLRLNVKELGVDMLSFSGHKFYGPKGTGVLYIKNGTRVEKFIGGGEQERGMRGGTLNVAGIVGLAKAYEIAVRDMQENHKKVEMLSQLFLQKLQEIDGVKINGNRENAIPSVMNVRLGVENTAFLYRMDLRGAALSAGSACASASIKPSHVLTAMGLDETQAGQSVRFSFGKENTVDEVLKCAEWTKEIVLGLVLEE